MKIKPLIIGLTLAVGLWLSAPGTAQACIIGESPEDCDTVGEICVGGCSGDPLDDHKSSGNPLWRCEWNPQCVVTEVYDPDYGTVRCNAEYQYSEECKAVDYCCDGTGSNEKVCYRYCKVGGCEKGGHYKTCCNTDGSFGTCGITEPFTPSCSIGELKVDTVCTAEPTATATPTGIPPADDCNDGWTDGTGTHQCSDWNHSESGCWANGQFPGADSCKWNGSGCQCGGSVGSGGSCGWCDNPCPDGYERDPDNDDGCTDPGMFCCKSAATLQSDS